MEDASWNKDCDLEIEVGNENGITGEKVEKKNIGGKPNKKFCSEEKGSKIRVRCGNNGNSDWLTLFWSSAQDLGHRNILPQPWHQC